MRALLDTSLAAPVTEPVAETIDRERASMLVDNEVHAFWAAWRARRCLIPADGFYEWTRRGGEMQPWLFGLKDGGPFAFAGLWEHWTVPEGAAYTGSLAEWAPGEAIETCTILTTVANAAVE